VLLLAAAGAADAAALTINIQPITVFAGETSVTVLGSFTNATGATAFLNGDTVNLPATLTLPASINDIDFFNNTPPSLANGASTGLVALFTFDVLPGAASGAYAGVYSVLGGIGAGNFDVVGSQTFTVNVAPEPNLTLPLGISLAAFCLLRRKQSKP
jgi:hypothetical protein